MAVLVACNLGDVVSEFIGVASSFQLFGVSKFISVPSAAALVWVMIVFGDYKKLEKIFVFLSFLYIAYVVTGILARPSWLEVSRHLVRIPSLRELRQPGYLYLSVGGSLALRSLPGSSFICRPRLSRRALLQSISSTVRSTPLSDRCFPSLLPDLSSSCVLSHFSRTAIHISTMRLMQPSHFGLWAASTHLSCFRLVC